MLSIKLYEIFQRFFPLTVTSPRQSRLLVTVLPCFYFPTRLKGLICVNVPTDPFASLVLSWVGQGL